MDGFIYYIKILFLSFKINMPEKYKKMSVPEPEMASMPSTKQKGK